MSSFLPLGTLDSIFSPVVGLNVAAMATIAAVALGTSGGIRSSKARDGHFVDFGGADRQEECDGTMIVTVAGMVCEQAQTHAIFTGVDVFPDDHTCAAYGPKNEGVVTVRKAIDADGVGDDARRRLALDLASTAADAVRRNCEGSWVPLHPAPGRWLRVEDISVDTLFGVRLRVFLSLVGMREAIEGSSSGPSLAVMLDATDPSSTDPNVVRGIGRAALASFAATCAAQLVAACTAGDSGDASEHRSHFRLSPRHELRHVVRFVGRPDGGGGETLVAEGAVRTIAALRSLSTFAVFNGAAKVGRKSVAFASTPAHIREANADANDAIDIPAFLARRLGRASSASGGVPRAALDRLIAPSVKYVIPVARGNPWGHRLMGFDIERATWSVFAMSATPSRFGWSTTPTGSDMSRRPFVPTKQQDDAEEEEPHGAADPVAADPVATDPVVAMAADPGAAADPSVVVVSPGSTHRSRGSIKDHFDSVDTLLFAPSHVDDASAIVYVLGDLDGVDTLLFALLSHLRLIEVVGNNNELRWLGAPNVYVVQCGDQIDSKRVRDRTKRADLRPELDLHVLLLTDYLTSISGGHFVSIVGNHEWMNVYGDFRYVHVDHADLDRATYFRRDNILGLALRRRKIMFRVNSAIFTHAGLTNEAVPTEYAENGNLDGLIDAVNNTLAHEPFVFDSNIAEMVNDYGVEDINKMAGGALDDFDDDGFDDDDDEDFDDADADAPSNVASQQEQLDEVALKLWFGTVWDPERRGGLKESRRKPTDIMTPRGVLWTRWLKPSVLIRDVDGRIDIVPRAFKDVVCVQVTGHNKNTDYPGRMEMVVEKSDNRHGNRMLLTNDEIAMRPLEPGERALVMTDTMPIGDLDSTNLAIALRYLEIRWTPSTGGNMLMPVLSAKRFECSGNSQANTCPRIALGGVLGAMRRVKEGASLWLDTDPADQQVLAHIAKVREFVAGANEKLVGAARAFGTWLPAPPPKPAAGVEVWWWLDTKRYAGNPIVVAARRAVAVQEQMRLLVRACKRVLTWFAQTERYASPKDGPSLSDAISAKDDARTTAAFAKTAIDLWNTAAASDTTQPHPPRPVGTGIDAERDAWDEEFLGLVKWILAAIELEHAIRNTRRV
jgi:hypothetical protein